MSQPVNKDADDKSGGDGLVRAPWTDQQVDALNAYQRLGRFHPYTCGNDHLGSNRNLVATVGGWICPHCDYRQNWAHPFMLLPTQQTESSHAAVLSPLPTLEMLRSRWPLLPDGRTIDPHGAFSSEECEKVISTIEKLEMMVADLADRNLRLMELLDNSDNSIQFLTEQLERAENEKT